MWTVLAQLMPHYTNILIMVLLLLLLLILILLLLLAGHPLRGWPTRLRGHTGSGLWKVWTVPSPPLPSPPLPSPPLPSPPLTPLPSPPLPCPALLCPPLPRPPLPSPPLPSPPLPSPALPSPTLPSPTLLSPPSPPLPSLPSLPPSLPPACQIWSSWVQPFGRSARVWRRPGDQRVDTLIKLGPAVWPKCASVAPPWRSASENEGSQPWSCECTAKQFFLKWNYASCDSNRD